MNILNLVTRSLTEVSMHKEGQNAMEEAFVREAGGPIVNQLNSLSVIPTFLAAFGIATLIISILALYVYWAWVWMDVAKKLKYKKAWLAWIPIANLFLIPILAKKKWTWGFMFLVPVASLVFWFIWTWKIFEMRKLYGFYSMVCLIPGVGPLLYLVALGFLAWKK